MKKTIKILLIILILAAFLRLFNLTAQDVTGDDATYAYRSIDYFDHMVSQLQTTPLQWFEEAPWWVKLSFHDHPPLIFFIHFIFFKIFSSMSLLIARLPDALMGVASVFMVYLLGLRLGRRPENKQAGKNWGLLAAFLLAVDPFHIWISRVSLLESGVIFFSLLAVFLFISVVQDYALRQDKTAVGIWVLAGLSLGLALLTKYSAFYLIPAFLMFLIFQFKYVFKTKQFWYGLGVFFLTLTPVIVYNIMLYKTQRHFDLQLSGLLGIDTDHWSNIDRTLNSQPLKVMVAQVKTLWQNLNPLILSLAVLGLGNLVVKFIKKGSLVKSNAKLFLILLVLFLFIQQIFIGATDRFLTLYTPWLALFAAWAAIKIYSLVSPKLASQKILKYSGHAVVSLLGLWLVFFGYNSQVKLMPVDNYLLKTQAAKRNYFGYNELDSFINKKINEEIFVFEPKARGLTSSVFIWDENINYFPKLWYLQRWLSYEGIPFASSNEWQLLGREWFEAKGYKKFYFIKAERKTFFAPTEYQTNTAKDTENQIKAKSDIEVINNKLGEPMFSIYTFN